jgi:hypothetical protein
VQPVHLSLIVDVFKLFNKLDKTLVSLFDLGACNMPLHDNLYTSDELAKVFVVFFG